MHANAKKVPTNIIRALFLSWATMCVTPITGYVRRHVRLTEQGKDTMKSLKNLQMKNKMTATI